MNPLELSASDVEYWSQRALEKFKSEYMTAKEVEEVYKISMSRQTQLIKSKKVIVVNDSQRVYYERSFAAWFFSAYVAKQTAKASTREAKKAEKKSGRPKKVKGEYTYTLWGQEYTTTEDPDIVFHNVRQWVMSRWPDYYTYTEKGYKPIGEKINQHPEDLREEMRHVSESFKQAKKAYKND